MSIASNLSFSTATSILAGTAGAIVYQSAANTTAFLSIGTNGYVLTSNGSTPAWSAVSGLTAGNATNLSGGQAWQIPYQSAPSTTAFASSGTTGQFWQATTNGAPTWTTTANIYVANASIATNVRAGTAGQLHYQSAADTTGFISTATTGNFLQANYVGAPTWTTTANIYVNSSVNAEKLYAGTAMSIVYQSAANTTAFLAAGTSGYVLQTNGTGSAPTWVAVTGLASGSATTATNLAGGTAGQIPYQSNTGTTSFIGTATTGNFLQANYVGAPTWTTTANIYIANASISTNLRAGTAWQIPYQSAANTTAFANSGTTGQFWQATTNGAPTWTGTGSMYVYRATIADSATGGAGSVANALTINNGGSGVASGSTYNGSAAVTISYNSVGASGAGNLTDASSTRLYNSFLSLDSRNTNYAPGDRSAGLYADFKANTTDSLSDGGTYHGVLTFRSYGQSNTDFTGGIAQQIAYTDNSNLWHRGSTNSSTWGTWYKVIDTGNTSTAYVGRAVIADSASGGSSQVNTVIQTASADYYLTFVDSNNASAAAESVYTTSSFVINPANRNVGLNKATPTESLYIERAGTQNLVFLNQTGSASVFTGMSVGYNGAEYFASKGNINTGEFQVGGKNASGYFTTIYSNNAETVRIAGGTPGSGGFLGVGYTSATGGSVLAVNGGAYVNGNFTATLNASVLGSAVIGASTTTNKFEVRGTSGQLFSVSDTFTGTVFAASDVSGIPSIEVLDTGLVKLAQYNGTVAISTGTAVSGSGLAVWTSTYILSLGVGTSGSGTIGEIRATNEVTAYYSDRRLKENVQVIDNALVKVLSLTGITYTANEVAESFGYDRTKKLVGVFADEIEAVLPEAVRPAPFDLDDAGNSKSGENYKTVQYEKIVPLLIEAIKEQQEQINLLKQELTEIKNSTK